MMLIDTDIAIDHFHGNRSARDFFEQALTSGEPLFISVVTLTELLAGMRPNEEEFTEKLLSLFTIIEVDTAIGRQAGAYLRKYSRSHKLDFGDALIAATASVLTGEAVSKVSPFHNPNRQTRVAGCLRGQ